MIVEIRHRTDPTQPSRHCVMCEGCKTFGPEVTRPPDSAEVTDGRKAAEEAALAAGWVLHNETVRTPIRKSPTASWCEQYFCAACQAAGLVGTIPHYTRPHKKKQLPAPASTGV